MLQFNQRVSNSLNLKHTYKKTQHTFFFLLLSFFHFKVTILIINKSINPSHTEQTLIHFTFPSSNQNANKQTVLYDVVCRWRFRSPTWRRCTRSSPIPWAPIIVSVVPLKKPLRNLSLDVASAHASWYSSLSLLGFRWTSHCVSCFFVIELLLLENGTAGSDYC
jgi:hypothetical protein